MANKGFLDKIVDGISAPLEASGEFINKFTSNTIKGVFTIGKSSIGTILSIDKSGTIIKLIRVFNIRNTVAEVLYPVVPIQNEVKNNPEDPKLRIDLFEQLERQIEFRFALTRALVLIPFSKHLIEQLQNEYKAERSNKREGQVDGELIQLVKSLQDGCDTALDSDCTEQIVLSYKYLIKCKLIQDNRNTILEELEILQSMSQDPELDLLWGRFFLQEGKFENGEKLLIKAMNNKVLYASDYLAQLYDKWLIELKKYEESNREIIRDVLRQKEEQFFILGLSMDKIEILKDLPISLIQVKWREIKDLF
ncbi:MAG: hypothetical protein KAG61_04950 [Bacteriovoracaceae bacterium]|nr:hypothetical protein [Bacteriovoracaceae bacterium]